MMERLDESKLRQPTTDSAQESAIIHKEAAMRFRTLLPLLLLFASFAAQATTPILIYPRPVS